MKMASNLVSIFCVNDQLLQTFKVINPDAFVTGFGGFESCEDSFMMGGGGGCAMLIG